MEKNKLQAMIINFFTKYDKPTDNMIHAFAKKIDVDKEKLENEIYELLSAFLYNGEYNNQTRSGKRIKLDKGQLQKGIDVEYEHTNNKLIAQRIAIDHLAELVDYYNRLEKMENE
jgi:hypothetical protein